MKGIKENWEAFTEPLKQEFENLKHIPQNIMDTAKDKMDEIKKDSAADDTGESYGKRKKGCSWSAIKWVLILCAVGVVLSECSNSLTDNNAQATTPTVVTQDSTQATIPATTIQENTQPTTPYVGTEPAVINQLSFIEKQVEYAEKCDVELHRFPEEELKLANWIESSNEKSVYLTTDNIFGADQYKITEKNEGYLYCGQLKDNRPDGYGILFVSPKNREALITYQDQGYSCRYIGQFSEGRFDGFGVLFTESENGHAFLSRLRPYDEATGENILDFLAWANYAEYFGEFSDGYRDGIGNSFNLSDFYIGSFENALSTIDLDNPNYSIGVGEYKKDQRNGVNKQYIGGYLYYDGEMKDDMFDGYGVLYYYGTNIPSYEGEFKNDMRHGTGTSYSETGEEIYTGEWKYDNYA